MALRGLIRALPLHAARHQLYVPAELLERHGVQPDEIFAGQSSAGLNAALAELRDLARRHLAATATPLVALPRGAWPGISARRLGASVA